ncbi:hypothetical protein BaRGS_00008795, partial [Batillaria attramentaria]
YLENVYKPGDLVCLVHAAEYKVDIGLPGAAVDTDKLAQITKAMKEEVDRIENLCGNYTEALRQKGIKSVTHLVQGEKPGAAIIRKAEELGAAIIIMGSRGLGKLRRTLMGSVSEYVLHHAPPRVAVTILRDS